MSEEHINNGKETNKSKQSRESLLDDQFKGSTSDKFLLINGKEKDHTKLQNSLAKQKIENTKPHIHKGLISTSSLEKYKNFLTKIEKSNEDLKNMDKESVRVDMDMLDQSCEDDGKECVIMDVSMGIFDVHNDNLNDEKLKDMNITVADVVNQEMDEQCAKDLIEEM
ncbi:hypothetical protein, conserved [Plasmodium gonderi]|uniref:Uncharacterized protein n=1 Tax=Plasmodium gonderi TaxID=77519 RepID=A0A1Y1JSV7_PLAGO|nr:hypothetical protein, conserved [Plasmodium gonderi]GAW83034.1 hypothetical protein, conserved [Plasmodium gonderi]